MAMQKDIHVCCETWLREDSLLRLLEVVSAENIKDTKTEVIMLCFLAGGVARRLGVGLQICDISVYVSEMPKCGYELCLFLGLKQNWHKKIDLKKIKKNPPHHSSFACH